MLEQRVQQNLASSQSNESNEPYRVENDEGSFQTKEGLNESAIDKVSNMISVIELTSVVFVIYFFSQECFFFFPWGKLRL